MGCVKTMDERIAKAIDADVANARTVEILNSAKEIGPVTVSSIVAELPELARQRQNTQSTVDFVAFAEQENQR